MNDNAVAGRAIREDTVVPVGEPWSGVIKSGEILRLIDLNGHQTNDSDLPGIDLNLDRGRLTTGGIIKPFRTVR